MRTRTFYIRLYRNIVNGRISWLKYFELPAELKSKEGLAVQGRPSLLLLFYLWNALRCSISSA